MLSTTERIEIKDLLSEVNDKELFSVLETVTKRMFTTSLRHEAIEKITSCIEKPSDILRRQKITKKILFTYLMKKGTQVLAEWDKPTLANECLKLWKSDEFCKEKDFEEVENQTKESCDSDEIENQTKESCDSDEIENLKKSQDETEALMGVEFSKWFFKILNTLDGFSSEHFWPSCNLTAQLCTPSDEKEVSITGADNVATFLANLILIDKFYFYANDSKDSIMVEVEEHGLVKIIIHGVLHQHANCVGLFDSAFGLVKHPNSPCTYKIQVIKVKMCVNCTSQSALPVNNQLSICQATC